MTGHHAVDCRARLGGVKALASLDPHARAAALTTPSSSAGHGSYVMAGGNSVQCRFDHAQTNDLAGWTADGPPHRSSVSWLQLLDVARPGAQRPHPRGPHPKPSRTRRPCDATDSDRFSRSRPSHRTLEGGRRL